MCMSYVALNARTEDPAWPMPDCQQVLDALLGGQLFSCLDLKAGFNNIPVDGPSVPYMAVTT